MRFVGHRVNYTKSGTRVARRDWPNAFAPTLLPAMDVEAIRELGKFDGVDASAVEGFVRRLRPYGQSPLYLALDEAVREFDNDSNEKSD